jgi:hypothetical protein
MELVTRTVQPIAGILRDQPKPYLAEGGLSDGLNIRVRNGSLETVPGYQSVYGDPQVAPLWVLPVVRSTTDHFWLYAGQSAVYVVDESNTHTDISDATYSATATKSWNGGILGTVPVINNGVDVPREWATVSTGTNLSKLSNWEADVASGATCKSLRPFQQYLVAMNTSEGATDYPQRVRWSDRASANSTPTWDATDAAQDAGFTDLLDSYDSIVDGLALRDQFVVYKENETYLMSFVGGSRVFAFRLQFKTSGMLAPNCAVEYRGRHYVLTQGDVVMHDGNSIESIIDRKNRDWLFSQIDPLNYERCFVQLNEAEDEVWFCFPENGESYATRALIYSLQNGTWGDRELPGVRYIGRGEIEQTGDTTWSNITGSWNSQTSVWNASNYNPAEERLVMAGTANTALYEVGGSNTADGTNIRCFASREADPFGNTDQYVRILKVRPIVEATDGTVFTITLGHQKRLGEAVSEDTYTFTFGTDEEVSTRTQGKYISWTIETEADVNWRLYGLEFQYKIMGKR